MKQILQNLQSGATELVEAPMPAAVSGKVLIQSRASLISAGTERMLVEFGQASWIGKARSQPDKVRQVLDKIRTDGLLPDPGGGLPQAGRAPAAGLLQRRAWCWRSGPG